MDRPSFEDGQALLAERTGFVLDSIPSCTSKSHAAPGKTKVAANSRRVAYSETSRRA